MRNRRSPLDIAATISRFSEGAAELTELIPELMLDGDRETLESETGQLVEEGVPSELATRTAILGPIFSALDIVDVAAATGRSLEATAGPIWPRLAGGCPICRTPAPPCRSPSRRGRRLLRQP